MEERKELKENRVGRGFISTATLVAVLMKPPQTGNFCKP
jgi:hypothetical protein